MYGKKIGMVNSAMERAIEFLKTTRKKSGDYIQKMAILKVNTNCQWCEEYGPEAVANYKFEIWKLAAYVTGELPCQN